MPYKDKLKQREYMRAYTNEWNKANIKGFYIGLNKKKDDDIISWLSEIENKQAYIKELIREEIKKA